MSKIRIPFTSLGLVKTKNPLDFLPPAGPEVEPTKEVIETYTMELSDSEEEELRMSDKEDSMEMFKQKRKKSHKKKERKKVKEDDSIVKLLLKKENVASNTLFEILTVNDMQEAESDKSSLESENDLVLEKKEKVKVLTKVPRDWALKKEWVIVSSRDFEWCTSQSSTDETGALSKFSKGLEVEAVGNAKEEFDRALMYWVFPGSPRPPSHIKEISKIIGETLKSKNQDWEYFKECQEEWKIAFRSAYFMVKNQKSPYFYYVNSEFSVLFSRENDSLCAYMSGSTVGLRKALNMDGLDFIEKSTSDVNSKKNGNYPLFFRGLSQVHGLYDFLLKWSEPRSDKRAISFPLLYSSCPFLNASLKSSKVMRSSKIQSVSGEGYRMVITGIIFPHSVLKLFDLFELKNEEFSVTAPGWEVTKGIQEARDEQCYKSLEFFNGRYYLK